MSDSELLKAFRNERSEQAFAELVRRYAGLVYSVAKRRVANATLAEDITQLVFIRFAKSPPQVLGHAQLAAWLHRTTLNVAIDTWRAETRRRAREQQAFSMQPATTEAAVWDDISPNLDAALDQLNDEDRQTLLLRFFGQKTMRDVGAATGVSEDAAKMRVSRAVEKLRTQLKVSGAACTGTVLGSLLAEHLVEAAPSHLVSRLASMRLPAAAGVAGMGGLLAAFLPISRVKLAVGAVALVAVITGSVHLLRSSAVPVPEAVTQTLDDQGGEQTGNANKQQIVPTSFNAPPVVPPERVMMLFHVVDAETGAGLANAKIHAAHFGAGGMGENQDLLTDNNGVAAIRYPQDAAKKKAMNVFVVAEGYVPKVVGFRNTEASPEYTLQLDSALAAGGLVLDEQGLPVAGVKVQIHGPGAQPGQSEHMDFQLCAGFSDDTGAWRFNYIPRNYTNEIRFILKRPGYAPTFPEVPVSRVDQSGARDRPRGYHHRTDNRPASSTNPECPN